jgi:hypothetical protein
MKKNKNNFFVSKDTSKEKLQNVFSTLSQKQLIDIKGGMVEEEEDGLDWKNYAESTSYNRARPVKPKI